MERKWKALILVDGYNGGVAHITADQIRDHNIAMYGDGDFVLPVGDKFAYEIVNNNTINLSSGMVVMNGARAVTGYGKTETLTIENGTSGYKRVDIIVAEYSKDNETLVESVTVKVVKGTLGSAYSDPALVAGDIRAGATKRQMALYRVKVNGLSIEAVEKMWTAAVATLGANIVPIAQGGTGKTTATEALKALGGASIKKVWENASIGSAFGAQTLQISTTADYILILTNRGVTIVVPKNAGKIIYYGSEAYPNQRGFTYTDNSLAVTIGEVLNSGWQTNNNALKPWYIFEIKGVI